MVSLLLLSFASAQESVDKGYIVGPGDVLQIQVWKHNDLNRAIEISRDETFSFPLMRSKQCSRINWRMDILWRLR